MSLGILHHQFNGNDSLVMRDSTHRSTDSFTGCELGVSWKPDLDLLLHLTGKHSRSSLVLQSALASLGSRPCQWLPSPRELFHPRTTQGTLDE